MGHNQRRALQGLDDVGHGEGLARTGDAEQDAVAIAVAEAFEQVTDGLGLIAGGLEVRDNLQRRAFIQRRAVDRVQPRSGFSAVCGFHGGCAGGGLDEGFGVDEAGHANPWLATEWAETGGALSMMYAVGRRAQGDKVIAGSRLRDAWPRRAKRGRGQVGATTHAPEKFAHPQLHMRYCMQLP